MSNDGCRTSRPYDHHVFPRLSRLVWLLLLFSILIDPIDAAPSIWRRLMWRLRAGTTLSTGSDVVMETTTNTTNTQNDNATTTSQNGSDRVVSILSPATAIYNSVVSNNKTASEIPVPRQVQRRAAFLDRIALISSKFLRTEHDAELDPDDIHHHNQTYNKDGMNATSSSLVGAAATDDDEEDKNSAYWNAITAQSDLNIPGRHFHVVTTAALPWFTGTAVNPLLRAAYLHRHTQRINSEDVRQSHNHKTNNTVLVKTKHQQQQSSSSPRSWVTLVIPWLELPEDQETLYNGRVFASSQEQEEYIREWLRTDAKMPDVANDLDIVFYPARYHEGLGSIFAMGDIMDNLNNNATLDVCILEEPEHCNWYRAPGDGWTKRFHYVVGIIHTNYKEYASAHYSGLWTAPAIALISSAMVRAYCHRVIKLSDALQSFATEKETTSNVHGVRYNFIEEGKRRAQMLRNNEPWNQGVDSSPQIYFIGKLLWAKGLDLMIEMEDYFKQYTGQYFPIDVFGTGPDQRAIMRAFHGRRNSINKTPKEEALIEAEDDDDDIENYVLANSTDNNGKDESLASSAKRLHVKAKEKIAKLKETINSVELPQSFSELRRQPIPASFPGRVDHGILRDHKIFVNPSISEVLCTTTAEALAMNKFVIIPLHPSNTFFLQFPNCLAYRNKFEFVASLRWALTHDPEPLTEEQARMFTWEAATERLVAASAITWREALERERLGLAKLDERIAWFHNELGKGATGDMLRKVLGAGPASHQVKYQKALATKYNESEYEEGEESESEEDESGFSKKFQSSSFAQAIRATLGDISAFGIQ